MASLTSPPSQTPPCRFPAVGSSGVTPRPAPKPIVARAVGLSICVDIATEVCASTMSPFDRFVRSPLPSNGYRYSTNAKHNFCFERELRYR
jgi:hypothetical protein